MSVCGSRATVPIGDPMRRARDRAPGDKRRIRARGRRATDVAIPDRGFCGRRGTPRCPDHRPTRSRRHRTGRCVRPRPTSRSTEGPLVARPGKPARRATYRRVEARLLTRALRPSIVPTIASMAYDENLAERIRELLVGESDVTEKKMFGGLAFLIGGNMAVAASGQGGVMVRVDPASSDSLVSETKARLVEMRGRELRGWLRLDTKDLKEKRELARWVELGTTYARSLPAKP